jgi:hypothetical protein
MKATKTLPRSGVLLALTCAALRICASAKGSFLSVSAKRSNRLLRTGILLLCAVFVVPASFGFEYKVRHNFSLLPNSVGANPPAPTASWLHYEHTWAIDQATPPHDEDFDPVGQPGGLNNAYGTDREGRNGTVVSFPMAGGPGIPVNVAVVPIPVGGAWANLGTVTSTDARATATANAQVNVAVNPGNFVAPSCASEDESPA